MSAIDQVIARARMASDIGFTERRQFKLARARAIEKLRRFALADPYFYILEIIQAAVAGGATYVDIGCGEGEGDEVRISWTGGRVQEAELAQLFDFLFASKERLDLAHVRSLALGVNALLLFAPSSIVIESGDGTPDGTARMVIRQGVDQVEVGKAAGALDGTYIKAFGINRAKVGTETGRHGNNDGGLEYATIELRCLAAPVPIVFNGQSVFGWSRQRIPRVFGYRKIIEFDEGDLYGELALDPEGGEPSFQLLTHGVWIQTYQHTLLANRKLGGIVCFDRLHKTVDHSGFVRDDAFEEMWLRLLPYAETLVGGKAGDTPKITNAGGVPLSVTDLRTLLTESPRVIAIDPDSIRGSESVSRAEALAKLLDAELLRVPDSQHAALRVLGGKNVRVWRPDLEPDTDILFYAGAPVAEPAGPKMLPPVSLDSIASLALGEAIRVRTGLATIGVALGETGDCTATLHSPVAAGDAASGLLVRILTVGRRHVADRLLASAWPGRVLEVELPTCSPIRLTLAGRDSEVASDPIGAVCDHFAGLATAVLLEQDRRTLAGLGVGELPVGSPAARLALQVLARALVTRLRGARPGRASPGLSFSLVHAPPDSDPLELALLSTLSGRRPAGNSTLEGPMSLRELALLSDLGGGLIYGTIPEVEADLDGLDPDRVLALDPELERLIIGIVGPSGYVRVDARDVLARVTTGGQDFVVRDMAVGLRRYPDFPLAVEGGDPTRLDQRGQRDLLERLVAELRARVAGEREDAEVPALEREEHRRQALRHLQWAACRLAALGRLGELPALAELPLFLDIDSQAWSLGAILPIVRRGELIVHYAHGLGGAELGTLVAAGRTPSWRDEQAVPESLAISAFVLRLLAPLGKLRLAFDFDLDDHEAARGPFRAPLAFLVREDSEIAGAHCTFGIAVAPTGETWIPVTERSGNATHVIGRVEPPVRGMVGTIEFESSAVDPKLAETLERDLPAIGVRLLEQMLVRLPDLDDRLRDVALGIAFDFAGGDLTLIAERDQLRVVVGSPLADRILRMPVFDIGGPTLASAQRLIEQFRRQWATAGDQRSVAPIDWSKIVAAGTPKPLRTWLEHHVHPAKVVLPASKSMSTRPDSAGATSTEHEQPWPPGRKLDAVSLAWNLGHWLTKLRPDVRQGPDAAIEELPERDAADPHPGAVRAAAPGLRRPATRIWLREPPPGSKQDWRMIEGSDDRLDIDCSRPLVVRCGNDPSPSTFAWLLLACYAYLNEVTVAITNLHEQEFQRRVAQGLISGDLVLLTPPPTAR